MEGRVVWMIAQLSAVLANIHRGNNSPLKPNDFIPRWSGEELTDEEEWEIMNAKFEDYNAKIRTHGG